METFITIIHIIVALFMILVVLIQGGNQGGIGAAFGGGNTQGMFGASGATTFLNKITYGAAVVFMMTSIGLTILHGQGGTTGLGEKLEQEAATKAPEASQEEGEKPSPEAQ